MKKRREKSDKTNNSPENVSDEDKEEEEIKQVGIFKGFLVYDRIDQNNENELNFNINDYDNPFFQEWLILHHNKNNTNKTESRFSNLFKEILQIDKNKENNDNKNIENEINDKNMIPQNLIEDNEEHSRNIAHIFLTLSDTGSGGSFGISLNSDSKAAISASILSCFSC